MAAVAVVDLARTLVDIDSTTGQEAAAAGWVANWLRQRGYDVAEQPVSDDRFNVYAQLDPPDVVLSTHIDCVPPFFSSREKNGCLYGRGACDAKGILAAQMAALEALLSGILERWSIPPARVIAHSDMAPTRKTDPGPKFDWRRLALARLSVWPEDDPESVSGLPDRTSVDGGECAAAFRVAALEFGYPDARTEILLAAFRLRFRPKAAGGISIGDLVAMRSLAGRFPVDRNRGEA